MDIERKKMRTHASNRAKSRFPELGFNRRVYREASLCILEQRKVGDCKPVRCIKTQSQTRSLWCVRIKDTLVCVAYDKKKHAVVTIMPIEWKEKTPGQDKSFQSAVFKMFSKRKNTEK